MFELAQQSCRGGVYIITIIFYSTDVEIEAWRDKMYLRPYMLESNLKFKGHSLTIVLGHLGTLQGGMKSEDLGLLPAVHLCDPRQDPTLLWAWGSSSGKPGAGGDALETHDTLGSWAYGGPTFLPLQGTVKPPKPWP